MRPANAYIARLLAATAVATVLALSAAGCTTTSDDTTGSLGAPSARATPRTSADWRRLAGAWGARYRADPGDARAAIAYARALRAIGERAQAVAVLEQSSLRNPNDMPLLGAYGRALADAGQYARALDVLRNAQTPDNPDWRILNAQGAVLDQMGRHGEAQRHYAAALKIMPNQPDVLSNLGLSYALEKKLKLAEATLRNAVAQPNADPKARQNLALIVGLEGRFAEAKQIASAALPPKEAAANVDYLRQMIARKKSRRHPYLPSPDAGT